MTIARRPWSPGQANMSDPGGEATFAEQLAQVFLEQGAVFDGGFTVECAAGVGQFQEK